jgi:hypothetical protein
VGRFQLTVGCLMNYLRLIQLGDTHEPCQTGITPCWCSREYFVGTSRYLVSLDCRRCQQDFTATKFVIRAFPLSWLPIHA